MILKMRKNFFHLIPRMTRECMSFLLLFVESCLYFIPFLRVNAVTLLITIISLGNSENRNEINRAEYIFDLIDFNRNAKVTYDELVRFPSLFCSFIDFFNLCFLILLFPSCLLSHVSLCLLDDFITLYWIIVFLYFRR
jgi:hypothetical protein